MIAHGKLSSYVVSNSARVRTIIVRRHAASFNSFNIPTRLGELSWLLAGIVACFSPDEMDCLA
jgi:hypothetical protein